MAHASKKKSYPAMKGHPAKPMMPAEHAKMMKKGKGK